MTFSLQHKIFQGPVGTSSATLVVRALKNFYRTAPHKVQEVTIFLPYNMSFPFFYKVCAQENLVLLPKVYSLERPLGYAFSMVENSLPPLPAAFMKPWLLDFVEEMGFPSPMATLEEKVSWGEFLLSLWKDVLFSSPFSRDSSSHASPFVSFFQKWVQFLAERGCAHPALSRMEQKEYVHDHIKKGSGMIFILDDWHTTPDKTVFLRNILAQEHGYLVLPSTPSVQRYDEGIMSHCHPFHVMKEKITSLGCDQVHCWPFPHEPHECHEAVDVFLHSCTHVLCLPKEEKLQKGAVALREKLHLMECASEEEELRQVALLVKTHGHNKKILLVIQDPLRVQAFASALSLHHSIVENAMTPALFFSMEGNFLVVLLDVLLDPACHHSFCAFLRHPIFSSLLPSSFCSGVEKMLRGYRWTHNIPDFLREFCGEHSHPLFLQKMGRIFAEAACFLQNATERSMGDWVRLHAEAVEKLVPHFWCQHEYLLSSLIFFAETYPQATSCSLSYYRMCLTLFLKNMKGSGGMPLASDFPQNEIRIMLCTPKEAFLMQAEVCVLVGCHVESSGFSQASHGLQDVTHAYFAACVAHCLTCMQIYIITCAAQPASLLVRLKACLHSAQQSLSCGEKIFLSPTAVMPMPQEWLRAPCLDGEHLPRKISVTRMELWKKNPYAFYMECVLKIRPLEPVSPSVDKRFLGVLLHRSLEHFVRICPPQVPWSLEQTMEHMTTVLRWNTDIPHVPFTFFQRGALERTLRSIAEREYVRRQDSPPYISFTEVPFHHTVDMNIPVMLTARADRVDIFSQGNIDLIDYKTGVIPTAQENLEEDLQLPLEAWLLFHGGNAHITPPLTPEHIKAFWWTFSLTKPLRYVAHPRDLSLFLQEDEPHIFSWLQMHFAQQCVYEDTGRGWNAELQLLSRKGEEFFG